MYLSSTKLQCNSTSTVQRLDFRVRRGGWVPTILVGLQVIISSIWWSLPSPQVTVAFPFSQWVTASFPIQITNRQKSSCKQENKENKKQKSWVTHSEHNQCLRHQELPPSPLAPHVLGAVQAWRGGRQQTKKLSSINVRGKEHCYMEEKSLNCIPSSYLR